MAARSRTTSSASGPNWGAKSGQNIFGRLFRGVGGLFTSKGAAAPAAAPAPAPAEKAKGKSRGGSGGGDAGGTTVAQALKGPTARDALSAKHFNGSGTVRRLLSAEPEDVKDFLGTHLSDKDLYHISGAPDGAQVKVFRTIDSNGRNVLRISAAHAMYPIPSLRDIYRDKDGKLVMHNVSLIVKDGTPKGMGTRIFASQVKHLARLGFDRIETTAGGPPENTSLNGYYTWARLGYNAPLSAEHRAKLPTELKGAKTTHDLMRKPGGAAWWKQHGTQLDMHFRLRSGSVSRKVLDAYLREKGIAL